MSSNCFWELTVLETKSSNGLPALLKFYFKPHLSFILSMVGKINCFSIFRVFIQIWIYLELRYQKTAMLSWTPSPLLTKHLSSSRLPFFTNKSWSLPWISALASRILDVRRRRRRSATNRESRDIGRGARDKKGKPNYLFLRALPITWGYTQLGSWVVVNCRLGLTPSQV